MKSLTASRRLEPSGRQIAGHAVQRRGQRGHRSGGQRQAHVATDGRLAEDLPGGVQRVGATPEQRESPASPQTRDRRTARPPCRSRRSEGHRRRRSARASRRRADRSSRRSCGWGSANREVPPGQPTRPPSRQCSSEARSAGSSASTNARSISRASQAPGPLAWLPLRAWPRFGGQQLSIGDQRPGRRPTVAPAPARRRRASRPDPRSRRRRSRPRATTRDRRACRARGCPARRSRLPRQRAPPIVPHRQRLARAERGRSIAQPCDQQRLVKLVDHPPGLVGGRAVPRRGRPAHPRRASSRCTGASPALSVGVRGLSACSWRQYRCISGTSSAAAR